MAAAHNLHMKLMLSRWMPRSRLHRVTMTPETVSTEPRTVLYAVLNRLFPGPSLLSLYGVIRFLVSGCADCPRRNAFGDVSSRRGTPNFQKTVIMDAAGISDAEIGDIQVHV